MNNRGNRGQGYESMGRCVTLAVRNTGQVAQLVEQWTENPCVGGSIPPLSTYPRFSSGRPEGTFLG